MDRKKVKTELRAHARERGVYAFVVGESIRYLGETADNLKERAVQYSKPGPSQTTNLRVHRLMKKEIRGPGAACEIWFLSDQILEKGRLYLDLGRTRLVGTPDRSAVKRTLIARWDPNWNRR